VYFISRKSSENRQLVEFELAASFDLDGVRIPKRQILPADFPGIGSFYS
jgi:phage-related protein